MYLLNFSLTVFCFIWFCLVLFVTVFFVELLVLHSHCYEKFRCSKVNYLFFRAGAVAMIYYFLKFSDNVLKNLSFDAFVEC
jgi:hypothetical protein